MTQYLYIPPKIYDELIKICIDAQPNQASGLLIGDGDINGSHIAEIKLIEGQSLTELDFSGLNVIGFFHSCLTSPPVPSQKQVKDLAFLKTYHVMVSLKGQRPMVNGWHIAETVEHIPLVFDLDQQESRSFAWTQNQNIAMISIVAISIIALIILSIILLPPAP